ncbi:MAG TPA: hypothetical protein VFR68_14500 [Candidatus Dormibacteraeota bacterium]|nr:hypothetical protein [Candidatus Dormibacteraeota bacterium]
MPKQSSYLRHDAESTGRCSGHCATNNRDEARRPMDPGAMDRVVDSVNFGWLRLDVRLRTDAVARVADRPANIAVMESPFDI